MFDGLIDTPEEVAEALVVAEGWPVLAPPCPCCGARVAVHHEDRLIYLACPSHRPVNTSFKVLGR